MSPEMSQYEHEVRRLADRLRHLGESRLNRAVPGHPSLAAAALTLAQELADLRAEVTAEPQREVPDLGAFAVGDQVAVTGLELARAAETAPAVLVPARAAVERVYALT